MKSGTTMPRSDIPLAIGDRPQRIRARWVFPADTEPLEDALIVIEDGQIADIQCCKSNDPSITDLGNVAIIPGLINAHAHLEFSDLSEPIQPPNPFTGWIKNLMGYRNSRETPHAELIADGLAESVRCGTSTVGEIATGDWAPPVFSNADTPWPQLIAFRECIGLRPEQQAEQLQLVNQHIDDIRVLSAAEPDNKRRQLTPAISPHAPYSVAFELFESLVSIAGAERLPLCIHLAETRLELQLLADGTGDFVDMLSALGIWNANYFNRGARPLDYLRKLVDLDFALIAHGNYLDEKEIEFLGKHPNIAVVYCPRTHHFFGHPTHPWQRLQAAGATVCLGTDGRSSNPDYSLWAELQFVNNLCDVANGSSLLQMGTTIPARALGIEDCKGRIANASDADLTIIQLPDAEIRDPHQLLFDSRTRPIATLIDGIVASCNDS
jgi:cytosine/adenosine deaminase-related metal-dependent hydrolase